MCDDIVCNFVDFVDGGVSVFESKLCFRYDFIVCGMFCDCVVYDGIKYFTYGRGEANGSVACDIMWGFPFFNNWENFSSLPAIREVSAIDAVVE